MFPDALRPFFPPVIPVPGSVCLLPEPPGRHLVDCRANAYAKSRPPEAESRRSKGSGDARSPRPGARCAKCFKIDIGFPASVSRLNARRRAAQRIKNFYSGFSRTLDGARVPSDRRGAQPVEMTECFKAET
ncbi:hypothetical protein BCEP4_510067 [Burkholderia cepacia]|nr:hypothetical protein BCEP4_510067 [Burkholderia cepacia]